MPRHLKEQQARKAKKERIRFDPYLDRNKPVARPIAENAIDKQSVTLVATLHLKVQAARIAIRKLRLDLYFCFILQLEYALRISEVLDITPEDITSWGEIRVRGKKGGSDRLISSDAAREFILKQKAIGVKPFGELNEDYVRRAYKSVGLFLRLPGRSKDSVTHLFRHIAAMSARDNNFGNAVITNKLGHKSNKTQEHYGK